MANLTISVALGVCNGVRYLPAQLESLANQSRLPMELVIRDDASTDATPDLVESMAASIPFAVRLARNPTRLGPAKNFAQAIAACQGEVILLCDQDDVWLPEKVASLVEPFERCDAIGMAFSDLEVVDDELRPLGYTQWQAVRLNRRMLAAFHRGQPLRALLRYSVINGNSMAIRARLAPDLLPIGEGWLHDEWIALVASAISGVAAIPRPLLKYRRHAQQQVGPGKATFLEKIRYARRQANPGYFARMVARHEVLLARLELLRPALLDARLIELVEARLAHSRQRWQAHQRSARVARLPIVASELLRGNYHRFGIGLKNAIQDLFL